MIYWLTWLWLAVGRMFCVIFSCGLLGRHHWRDKNADDWYKPIVLQCYDCGKVLRRKTWRDG